MVRSPLILFSLLWTISRNDQSFFYNWRSCNVIFLIQISWLGWNKRITFSLVEFAFSIIRINIFRSFIFISRKKKIVYFRFWCSTGGLSISINLLRLSFFPDQSIKLFPLFVIRFHFSNYQKYEKRKVFFTEKYISLEALASTFTFK